MFMLAPSSRNCFMCIHRIKALYHICWICYVIFFPISHIPMFLACKLLHEFCFMVTLFPLSSDITWTLWRFNALLDITIIVGLEEGFASFLELMWHLVSMSSKASVLTFSSLGLWPSVLQLITDQLFHWPCTHSSVFNIEVSPLYLSICFFLISHPDLQNLSESCFISRLN